MKYLLFIAIVFSAFVTKANPDETFQFSSLSPHKGKSQGKVDKSKILIGPGIGFGAGYRAFSFNLAPSVAYCFTEQFHVGTTIGLSYYQEAQNYSNYNTNISETYKLRLTDYSWSVYARYILFNNLILNVEPELNNTKYLFNTPFQYNPVDFNQSTGKFVERSTRKTIGSFLVGAGYIQRFQGNSYSYLMVCYDLVQNPNAFRYYQTIDFRVGIMIALK